MFSDLEIIQHKDISDKNSIRVEEQEKQYRYYSGDSYNILKYLVSALKLTYSSEDINEMQKEWINITEKVINQMSVVYADHAIRKVLIGDSIDEALTEYYLDILPMNVNTSDKEAHRLAKLHNTSLTHVTFEKGRFKYNTLPSYLYDVKHEDGNITELSYQKMFGDDWYRVYWTDTEHYRRDAFSNQSGIPIKGGENKDMGNPFGVIPFPKLRLKNSIDFWGEGQSDIINVNEQVNLLITKLINSDVIMGTEGTVLGINLDLHMSGEEKSGEKKIRTGRRHPISVNNVKTDDQVPSLQHITADPYIMETMQTIDWYIRLLANFNGLNPNAVMSAIKDTSDFQKIMDAVEQMEIRRDDIEPCRMYEHERFEITKRMNNALVGTEGADNLKEIPEEATLWVDFVDIEIQKTPDERRKDYDWNLQKNLTTLPQIMVELNPDLNIEQAKKVIADNKSNNSELGGTLSRFELLTKENNNNNNPEEENNA